jgi:hypothetical protein
MLTAFQAQEEERVECVHPLVNDPLLRNFVVAWSMSEVEFHRPEGEVPGDEASRWNWLWEGVEFDRREISNALKIDQSKVGRLVQRAAAFRLIYPDGTVNQKAIMFIRAEIAKAMSSKKGGRPKNSAPPAPAGR